MPDSNFPDAPEPSKNDMAGRIPDDAYRMAALEGDYDGSQFRPDAAVEPGCPRIESHGVEGAWVEAQVWVPRAAAIGAEKRLDSEDSPGRPVRERPTCALCDHTIRFRGQERSSPFGTVHHGCAERHEREHPEQW